jgi:hypothetical protein
MNTTNYIRLTNAKYLGDYKVELQFDDNVTRQIDFSVFLNNHSHPQYNKYKELTNFRKFKIAAGNIVWGENWDLGFNLRNLYEGKNPV